MKTSELLRNSPLKTSEVLRKAADEIRRRGWHQGDYESADGCVCSLGAIGAVGGDPWLRSSGDWDDVGGPLAEQALKGVVGSSLIANWNDNLGRTVEEVLDAFERAAVAAEAEES